MTIEVHSSYCVVFNIKIWDVNTINKYAQKFLSQKKNHVNTTQHDNPEFSQFNLSNFQLIKIFKLIDKGWIYTLSTPHVWVTYKVSINKPNLWTIES